MQNMSGGLDQQINDRVDTYRNNPQALQQRYTQNQQLIDLLALQKLKSEKDAAARDIQMQMQQQPQTIKQQREAELMQRTKEDMVKQTSGIMQQRQQQQQKNMQNVAQGKLPAQPRMPMAQQAGGLGGLPMPKMAAGGIVAFQQGRDVNALGNILGVTPEEIEAYRRSEGGVSRRGTRLSDQEIARRIRRDREASGLKTRSGNIMIAEQRPDLLSETEQRVMSRTGRAPADMSTRDRLPNAAEPAIPTPFDMPAPRNIPTLPDAFTAAAGNIPTDPTGGPIGFNVNEGTAAMPTPTTPTTPPAQPKSDTSGIASLKEKVMTDMPTGVDASGANAAFQQGLAAADAYTKRDERYADLAKRRDEYEQFMKDEYSPERRRFEGISQALMAGYGAGGAGAVFSRAGQRMSDFNEGLRMQRAKGMLDSFNMTMNMNKTDAELAQMGMTTANAFRQDYMANQRAAMSAATQLGVQKLRMLDSEADRILAREKESNSQIYRMATLALEEQQRIDNALKDERLDDRQRIQLGQRGLELFQSVQEGMASLAADRTGLTSLQTQMETAQALQDEDEIARLGPEIEAKQAETIALTTSLINDFGRVRDEDGNLQGTGLYDLIPRMIEMMGGNMSGIDVSDVTSVTTN